MNVKRTGYIPGNIPVDMDYQGPVMIPKNDEPGRAPTPVFLLLSVLIF
jgi:hypothetical protein